jgi:hypothetical protein
LSSCAGEARPKERPGFYNPLQSEDEEEDDGEDATVQGQSHGERAASPLSCRFADFYDQSRRNCRERLPPP